MGFGRLIGMATAPQIEDRHCTDRMARTHKKVRFLPKGKQKHTEASATKAVEEVLRILEGRWKLVILLHLFGGKVRRFSELGAPFPPSPKRCSFSSCGRWNETWFAWSGPTDGQAARTSPRTTVCKARSGDRVCAPE
jgi:hypothetical protein